VNFWELFKREVFTGWIPFLFPTQQLNGWKWIWSLLSDWVARKEVWSCSTMQRNLLEYLSLVIFWALMCGINIEAVTVPTYSLNHGRSFPDIRERSRWHYGLQLAGCYLGSKHGFDKWINNGGRMRFLLWIKFSADLNSDFTPSDLCQDPWKIVYTMTVSGIAKGGHGCMPVPVVAGNFFKV